ncbi:MAG TPA: hypothetical protein VK324_18085 [Tepidisphaeraceae bacterium]|nr:hypothetical protein [Tepidisphaeraceae bacterium]
MSSPSRSPKSQLPPELRRRLDAARLGLLTVHKALLDYERSSFESLNGPVASSGQFLQIVINDPFFAWLHPLSQMIVQIDEVEVSREPTALADATALLARAKDMIQPNESGDEFQRRYHHAIQESAEVAVAHGDWRRRVSAG